MISTKIFLFGSLACIATIPVSLLLPPPLSIYGVVILSIAAFAGNIAALRLASADKAPLGDSSGVASGASIKHKDSSEMVETLEEFSPADAARGPSSASGFASAFSVSSVSSVSVPASAADRPPVDPVMVAVYKFALPVLFESIVSYLNGTSEPMTETLVRIKTSIADFQGSVRASKTHYEKSGQSTDIKEGIHLLRSHITEVTQETSRSFTEVSSEIAALDSQMMAILGIVANISDVAERIHVLSINASIEAARAGAHGRGFKVIADEVQRLSRETQGFVSTIGTSVSGTQKAFVSLHGSMEKNRKEVDRFLQDDNSTYTRITETIDSQLAGVMALYSAVMGFIESLEMDMSAFAPLGMLHAIITQEIENLARVSADLSDICASGCPHADPAGPRPSDPGTAAAVEKIRSRLTTSRELDALEKALRAKGLHGDIDLKRNNTEIEFF